MSTSTAHTLAPIPTGEVADETVRRTVFGLIKGRGLRIDDVADAVGIAHATMYRRLGGWGEQQAFRSGEIASLAVYFGISLDRLFTGLDGTFVPPTDPDGKLIARAGTGVGPAGLEPTTSAVEGAHSVLQGPWTTTPASAPERAA